MRKFIPALFLMFMSVACDNRNYDMLNGTWSWIKTETCGNCAPEFRGTLTPETENYDETLILDNKQWTLIHDNETISGEYKLKEQDGILYMLFSDKWIGDKEQFIELEPSQIIFRECPSCSGSDRKYWSKK